jgi:hypothetical protein
MTGYRRTRWSSVVQEAGSTCAVTLQLGPLGRLICEPASHYYHVMTRSNRMPVLIEERI